LFVIFLNADMQETERVPTPEAPKEPTPIPETSPTPEPPAAEQEPGMTKTE